MHWIQLTDVNQLPPLIQISKEQSASGLTVLIFKHSTRCSISAMALHRLESRWKDTEKVHTYFIDLLAYRDVSNEVATLFNVEHASPQVLLIRNGQCLYHHSHNGISVPELEQAIATQHQ